MLGNVRLAFTVLENPRLSLKTYRIVYRLSNLHAIEAFGADLETSDE